jgi:hypothetical protein
MRQIFLSLDISLDDDAPFFGEETFSNLLCGGMETLKLQACDFLKNATHFE